MADDDIAAEARAPGVLPVKEHALREALILEMHARPPEPLVAPERGSHLALLSGELPGAQERDRAHLGLLCARYGAPLPAGEAKHFAADLGAFRVKWERHTEFCTYTFFRHGAFTDPFAHPVIELVPKDWLADLPGQALGAVHFALEPPGAPERSPQELTRIFSGNVYFGSRVAGGAALAWTDLRMHDDRFSRVLVRDVSLSPGQAGRLIQRLLEINTYRLMALLALPLAREAGPVIRRVEKQLVEVAARMAGPGDPEADSELLEELTALAAEIEKAATANSYRFGAARAYYDLVRGRLADLREGRIQGLQMVSEFLERRLAPAMASCVSTAARQEELSGRAARAVGLLRARVDVQLEKQNRDLLESMNRRAKLQLRLQRTVEGLSVAAISYYLVGLVAYALKAMESAGVPVDVDLGTGLAVPVVVGVVWLGLQRVRRALYREGPG